MADDLNALLAGNRSASVLQGIANPPQVNPLAAINSGTQAAANIYNLRGLQAQEAWGNALQQATDENGVPDYQRAAAIARNDPRAAMGMMAGLTGASNLRSQQLSNTANHMKLVGTSAMTVANDPSDANINASFDNLKANGSPAEQVERERARWLAMPPAERQRNANRVGLLALEQLHQVIGQTVGTSTNGQIVAGTVTQPQPGYAGQAAGSVTQGGGPGINLTVSPDFAAQDIVINATAEMVERARQQGVTIEPNSPVRIPRSDIMAGQGLATLLPPAARINLQLQMQGRGPPTRNPDGTVPSPTNPAATPTPTPAPVRQLNVTPTAPAPTTVPAPGGGGGDPMRGIMTPAAPAARVPASGPPTVPISSLDAMGGVQTASTNALEAPVTGPPSAPSPLVPGDVQAIMQGMQGARDNRLPGTQVASPYYGGGMGGGEQTLATLSQERLAAGLKAGTEYARTMFPIAQALKQYGRGITTAPGAETANQWKGWIGGVSRSMGGPSVFDSTADFDKLAKDLNQVLMSNAGAGRSDASLAQTLAGNANTHIHEMAGEDVMKANGALVRAASVAASQWQRMPPEERAKYGHYFANYENDFNKTFDLRAGAYDMYNPAQAKSLLEDLRKGGKPAQDRFWNSVDLLERNGYLGDTRAMP